MKHERKRTFGWNDVIVETVQIDSANLVGPREEEDVFGQLHHVRAVAAKSAVEAQQKSSCRKGQLNWPAGGSDEVSRRNKREMVSYASSGFRRNLPLLTWMSKGCVSVRWMTVTSEPFHLLARMTELVRQSVQ